MKANEQFFYDNAGYCYNPLTENAEQGHVRCAKALAAAELDAKAAGVYFVWGQDDQDSSSFCNDESVRPLWYCQARSIRSKVIAQLSGIDLGASVTPHDSNRPAYCRIVEAELAAEAVADNS